MSSVPVSRDTHLSPRLRTRPPSTSSVASSAPQSLHPDPVDPEAAPSAANHPLYSRQTAATLIARAGDDSQAVPAGPAVMNRRAAATGGAPGDALEQEGGGVTIRDSATKQADQIVQHFYAKTCAIVSQSRMTHLSSADNERAPAAASTTSLSSVAGGVGPVNRRPVGGAATAGKKKGERTNSWFNLTLPEADLFRTQLKTWRCVSALLFPSTASPSSSSPSFTSAAPPLVLSVLLDVSDLTPNQVLVFSDQRGRRVRVDPALAGSPVASSAGPSPGLRSPRSGAAGSAGGGGHGQAPTVVLERWELTLDAHSASSPSSSSSSSSTSALQAPSPSELPSVYKHSILHFRALYTLVRTLPAWALHRKLSRRRPGVGGSGLKIGVRLATSEEDDAEGREGEVGVEVPIEAGAEEEKVTETIRFPGVATPLGTLFLSCTYRVNADFGVEDIETLLSSRFIDEDFFRPTVSTARYREREAAGRPGSLPISARTNFRSTSATAGATGLGTSPVAVSPPLTGLAPLPSYGSLSSRHQYAPHPPVPAPSHSPSRPAPVPLPSSASAGSRSSSHLSVAYGSVPASAGGTSAVVEPAFISLSRARGGAASYTGSGIQRASVSPSYTTIARRTSLTSVAPLAVSGSPSSGGSPIFRPGSYAPAVPATSAWAGSFAPPSRQPSTGLPPNATHSSQLSFGARTSPLAPPVQAGPSNLGATAPRPIPAPSPSARPYSYASGGTGSGSFSRSYGRGSSGSGGGGGIGEWAGPESLTRRASSRLSFGAATGTGSLGRSGRLVEEQRSFVGEMKPPEDADDINSFLRMIDSKPDLRGGLDASRSAPGGGGAASMLRKQDVDEQLKALRGSVLGFTGLGASPSPPAGMGMFVAPAGPGGSSPRTAGVGGGVSGISSLRRKTSRLSIEEEPAEYHYRTPRQQQQHRSLRPQSPPLSTPSTSETVHAPPASPRFAAARRGGLEPRLYPLPSSSTTSPLASPTPASPYPLHAPFPSLPLPLAAAGAAPAPYPPLPYPPSTLSTTTTCTTTTTTTTSTRPIAFSPYVPRAGRKTYHDLSSEQTSSAAASVESLGEERADGVEGDGEGEGGGGAAGGSSFYRGEEEAVGRLELDGEDDVVADAHGDEDDDGEAGEGNGEGEGARGRRWPRAGVVDEEEIAMGIAAARPSGHSRSVTPGTTVRRGGATGTTTAAKGYFAARSHSRGGGGGRAGGGDGAGRSPPEISWMG
ncbi:hypothetical protein JCM1841_004940 [Sporobolomyces salmonicolor]